MAARLHHAFILAPVGAPQAARLVGIGMQEGDSNTHPGQGTANRRFFFRDFYLELVYFTDPVEARTGPGRVIRSWDRFTSEAGSPFGLVFKADSDADADAFPGFPYQPVYFDEGQFFVVGDNAGLLTEPTCVLMPANLPHRPPQTLSPAPFEHLVTLRLSVPVTRMSRTLAASAAIERVEIVLDAPHLMELDFVAGGRGERFDLRPDLPLVIRA